MATRSTFQSPVPSELTSDQLSVNANIVIDGPGADMLAVNGRDRNRVFYISLGKTVTISGLTITQGKAGLVDVGFFGGGIYNDNSTLTVRNCTLSRNSADSGGGGIFNDGRSGGRATLSIINSTLRWQPDPREHAAAAS